MGVLGVIQLILAILSGLSSTLTKSNAPPEVIAGVEAAITELQKVHGTIVTKVQVDTLLDTPKW